MKKAQPISALIDFSLHDGYVESGGKNFYFYRYFPPNTDIMSAQEISEEIENLAALGHSGRYPNCAELVH